jgi:hypothetical protein
VLPLDAKSQVSEDVLPMRKAYKKKRRSCALCKAHKRQAAKRWKPRDMDIIRRAEKQIARRDFED